MRILHVAAEVHPLIKTGGLADVVGSLPAAQRKLGHEAAVLVPGFTAVKANAGRLEPLPADAIPGGFPARLLRGELDGGVELLVLDRPDYYARPGGPYNDEHGRDWPDNHLRFALLGAAAAALCRGNTRFDLLHAHDWHAGLAPAYLRAAGDACKSCFTIHNLAYQGRFGLTQYEATGLPWDFYRYDRLEYHGDWSFMKAALSFSDLITTVSPTYAREILRPEFGCGLEGLLNYRREDLHGILNGVDFAIWNPASDPALERRYSPDSLEARAANKRALQRETGLELAADRPLLGVVSRLTTQKGLDFALEPLAALLAGNTLQLALLGSGDPVLETAFAALAERFPARCSVRIGYDEALAHRIYGGTDAVLVPSRFEPCGLTQMYGLRYGSLPVVRRTGGLADTVTGYRGRNADRANGFDFGAASPLALRRALGQALKTYRDAGVWRRLVQNAMRCNFSWEQSARSYLELYARIATE